MERRENRKNPEKKERPQKEIEILLNEVGEMAHVGGWELDVRTKEVHWTKETYRIHDISEDEKFDLSKAVLFFDLPDRSTLEAALQRCMETGEPFDLELPFTSAKGRHLWTRAMGRAVNVGGKVVKLTGTFQDITEQRKMGGALKESEEKFRQLFTRMPSAVAIYDAVDGGEDFIFKDFNTAAEKIEGIKKDDLIGKRVTQVFPGVKNFGIFSVFQRVWRTGQPEFFPSAIYRDERDPGTWRESWVYKLASGEVIAIYHDITERKRAELELVSTQQTLKDAHRLAHIGTWNWVMENDTVTWSEELYNIAGRDPSLPAPTYAEHPRVYTPASWDRLSVAVTRALTTGEPYNLELELVRPDGSIRWVNAFGGVKRDGNGKVIGLHGTVQDITERKRVEMVLKETNLFLQNLFDYANAPIITWDPGFHITRFNHAFEHLTGRSQEVVLGKTLDLLFPDESRKASMALIQKTHEGERWETAEIPIFNIDGSTKTVLWNSANVLDSEGKLTATIAQGVDITERKRADAALKVSEHKYRTLVENIPEKIFVKDALLAYLSCNNPYARDLGIAAEAIAGKTDFDFYPRDLAEKYRADDRAVMESGATSTIDERYVLNGVEFWVSTVKTPIRDNAGNISGILGIFHDITEQKRAEEVIRESEERYRTLAEASPDQIFIVGRDDTMKYVNTAAQKMFRLPYDQVVGTPRKNLFPPDIADAQGILLKKIFETGEHVQTEEKIHFGTQELWIDTSLVPLKDETGHVTAVLGIARDITERRRIEEALRENELRYRSLFEGAAEGILVADIDTKKFLHANPAMFRMLGYSEGELTTLGVEDIHPKESLDYVIGEFIAQARGEKLMSTNIPLLRKDKTILYADISTTHIFIDGKMRNVGFFSDITERKKAEDTLKRFNEELEQQVKSRTNELNTSLKEKELLLKEIHHRVRNNLQVVSSIINLQAKSVSDPGSLKQIQEIRMRIGTLALVHEIAYLAKTPESINMRDFLHRCTSRVIDEFGCEPGRIDIAITAENVQVALNQAVPCSLIVNELLMNSIRHAFPGNRHGEIRIGFSIARGNYVLEYSDDGVGFPEGMHPEGAETGGLSLIQGLARQIRGTVESRTRPGTQYTLTFPAEIREDVNVWQK
jgi:PAS domain S-box-containing protein